jgi:hypothetical protein
MVLRVVDGVVRRRVMGGVVRRCVLHRGGHLSQA